MPRRLAPIPVVPAGDGARRAQHRGMANDRSGRNVHRRAGRAPPRPTDERVADESAPREDKSEPASGPRRDPLPDEWQDRGSDLPGLRKKIT